MTAMMEPPATPGANGGRTGRRRDDTWQERGPTPEGLALGLGWFSIGLGLAQLAAPRTVARMIGVRDDESARNALLAIGMREIASGVGILTRRQPAGWAWARVGGDLMDLALLGRALNADDSDRTRAAAATAAVLGVTVLDVLAGRQLSREGAAAARPRGVHVATSVTLNRSPDEVYRFWRDFRNLPRFMAHLEAVQVLDDRRSRWTAKAPAGATVEWEAEITDDRPNQLIAWRSLEHADVPNSGWVSFTPAPGDRGTEVRVELRYDPPAGRLGALVAKLFGEEPGQQVAGDLRRFKQVLETGEVVHSDASIHTGLHPAQPPAELPEGILGGSPS